MFHNISNPKWFGNWSRLEDDYLANSPTRDDVLLAILLATDAYDTPR